MEDSYLSIATISGDWSMLQRVTACAAKEGDLNPDVWASAHRWEWASQPGWGAAWDSALAGGNTNPGADPAVITDAQILSAVQSIRTSAE